MHAITTEHALVSLLAVFYEGLLRNQQKYFPLLKLSVLDACAKFAITLI